MKQRVWITAPMYYVLVGLNILPYCEGFVNSSTDCLFNEDRFQKIELDLECEGSGNDPILPITW